MSVSGDNLYEFINRKITEMHKFLENQYFEKVVKAAVKKGVDQLSEEIASDINQIEKGVTNTKLDFERFEE